MKQGYTNEYMHLTMNIFSFVRGFGVSETYFVTSLISFNLGVEFGQLAVISACFLLIGLWFGKKNWYRMYLTIPLSAIIAIIGLVWFVQRISL